MKQISRILLFFIFFGLMVGQGLIQSDFDNRRNYVAEHGTHVTLPSGKTLKVLSLGYDNLLADVLFIWSIQFYSTYNLTNRYDYLEHIFDVITDLNPTYIEPYLVGSWIMSLEARDPRMAIRLLQKGARNIPRHWIFDYESGFYAFKNLKDYELAEKYFASAAAKPDAPSHIARRRAHMTYMQDNLEYSWKLWKEILDNANGDHFAIDAANKHLHQIKLEMDRRDLTKMIKEFKARYGRLPTGFEELVRVGALKEIPKDYSGHPYTYNPKTGKVSSHKEYWRWKKSYRPR